MSVDNNGDTESISESSDVCSSDLTPTKVCHNDHKSDSFKIQRRINSKPGCGCIQARCGSLPGERSVLNFRFYWGSRLNLLLNEVERWSRWFRRMLFPSSVSCRGWRYNTSVNDATAFRSEEHTSELQSLRH